VGRKNDCCPFLSHSQDFLPEQVCIDRIEKSKKILDGATQQIREQYKSNTYDITYRGDFGLISQDLSGKYNILAHQENGKINKMNIQHLNKSSSGELIKDLVERVEIVSFNEVIPSMNEVFIKVVKQNA